MSDFDQSFDNLSALVSLSPEDKASLEKKTRREIANSNERRRMQSINSGFMRLKSLVPSISKEKVSKATILQQTGEYIEKLEREKKQLKQLLKTKDPTFNLDMEMDNDESEINQTETSESSSSIALDSPVNLALPQIPNVLDRTRQMLLSAQLLQSLNVLQNPIHGGLNSNALESDIKQNQLSSILQAMIKNTQSSQE